LVPELKQIDKSFSVNKFFNTNFGFLFKALGVRNLKEYSEYSYDFINLSGEKNLKLVNPSGDFYILLDLDKKISYSIEDTMEGLTHEEVVKLIGGFNPNSGLLDLYKNMYGYDVFLSKGKYIVKYSNDVYEFEKGIDGVDDYIVYHFFDQKNKQELRKFDSLEDVYIPSIIKLIKATLDGKNIKGINGGYVSKINNSKQYKIFKFYTPKEYISFEFDNAYDEGDKYIIVLIKNHKRTYLDYGQFQKNFPEFAKYVQ
jgi:hypothetical protein